MTATRHVIALVISLGCVFGVPIHPAPAHRGTNLNRSHQAPGRTPAPFVLTCCVPVPQGRP